MICRLMVLLTPLVFLFGWTPVGEVDDTYHVPKVNDFEVTGEGDHQAWEAAEWLQLTQRPSSREPLTTRVKAVYSETGIYFLFYCEDDILSATMEEHFMDLWTEDVVEVFLWPDESDPVYFEYQLSPLNYELAILVSNEDGDLARWQPFHYDEDRQTRHATAVQGGEKKSGASVESWTAEFFIPFKLMRPLKNISPEAGTRWRANLYRVDYDEERVAWSWQLTDTSYHEYEKFGSFIFE